MEQLLRELFGFRNIEGILDGQALVYLALILFIFWAAKQINNILMPYSIDEELTKKENKALALSLSGYLVGIGLILLATLDHPNDAGELSNSDLWWDLCATTCWAFAGIAMLQLARLINDKWILYRFCNIHQISEKQNIATGAVQCGGYIGSALIIQASLSGPELPLIWSISLVFLYFIVGQLGFIAFALMYQRVTRYHLHDEIEKNNIAAGVSFGMSMVAVGILLGGYIKEYDSITGLVAWFFISQLLLIVSRYIVDKIILSGALLDEEISRDQNWGAALIEGSGAIVLAMIVTLLF